ncbi:MAG: response regulator [Archangium sp.]|nr:response regulator [Archangium sp.]
MNIEETAFLEAIIGAVADPIFVKDEEHRWVVLNDAMCSFIGIPRERLLGHSDYDFFPKEQADIFWEKDNQVFTSGKLDVNVEELTGAAGTKYVIETKKSVFAAPSGKRFLVGVIRDITELRRHAEALEAAKRVAEAAVSTKAAFLANMSHEIRTPLHGIIGMAQLMLGTRLDPAQREASDVIMSSSNALLGILNDILDFSKIDAGRLTLERVPFDVVALMESCVEAMAAPAAERRVELVMNVLEGREVQHTGDPARLRQILTNLLGNAVKFTSGRHDEGVVLLELALAGPADAQRLIITVDDTGIGVPPAYRANLFQPFMQADLATTRTYGGTGLGLSICAKVAAAMGGSLRLESKDGPGARFVLELPFVGTVRPRVADPRWAGLRASIAGVPRATARALAQELEAMGLKIVEPGARADVRFVPVQLADAADEGSPVVALVAVGLTRTTHRPVTRLSVPVKRAALADALGRALHLVAEVTPVVSPRPLAHGCVLVVEDNATNQLVVRRLLARLGYDCVVCSSGTEALKTLSESTFIAVLMDCQMPEMDGLEATRRWRATESSRGLPPVPIVALTANASTQAEEDCRDAGMSAFLRKPVLLRDLEHTLQNVRAAKLTAPQ